MKTKIELIKNYPVESLKKMNNFEKEVKDIQTLNIEEVQELRDYYLKTATLFSSRSKIDTAHIYYALARECLKHKKELEEGL